MNILSLGGKPLTWSAGFWIEWDEESKTGILLTTANLVRSKEETVGLNPQCYNKEEHALDAQVSY
jgi:hypothetical protein